MMDKFEHFFFKSTLLSTVFTLKAATSRANILRNKNVFRYKYTGAEGEQKYLKFADLTK